MNIKKRVICTQIWHLTPHTIHHKYTKNNNGRDSFVWPLPNQSTFCSLHDIRWSCQTSVRWLVDSLQSLRFTTIVLPNRHTYTQYWLPNQVLTTLAGEHLMPLSYIHVHPNNLHISKLDLYPPLPLLLCEAPPLPCHLPIDPHIRHFPCGTP